MYNNNKKLKKSLSTQLGHKPLLSTEVVFWGIDTLLLKSVHSIFHPKPPPHTSKLQYSSVKHDTTKTIMSKHAHNIEENSTLEHQSPCINNVCTISSGSTFL